MSLCSAASAKCLAIVIKNAQHEKTCLTLCENGFVLGRRREIPSHFRPKSSTNNKKHEHDIKNDENVPMGGGTLYLLISKFFLG